MVVGATKALCATRSGSCSDKDEPVTVHTCTIRVEKVCKVREEPAPRFTAERDALGPHCLAASASWDFWAFPEAQCELSKNPLPLKNSEHMGQIIT